MPVSNLGYGIGNPNEVCTEETPLNSSLESYVEDQGIKAIHPLELL